MQDFDIDGFGEQGFFTSPAQAGSQKWSDNAMHTAVAALNAPDPPKIRVIVRKRPLNKKVLAVKNDDLTSCSFIGADDPGFILFSICNHKLIISALATISAAHLFPGTGSWRL